nr:hypothetical protein [Nitrospirota bacterium]
MRTTVQKILIVALFLLAAEHLTAEPVLAQSVSGVRGITGGVGALFNLTGPANMYVDTAGIQGYIYTPGANFESYSYRVPGGQAWSGAQMTLGPQLSVGLIAGSNQGGSPVVFPPLPRQLTHAPPIQSTLLNDNPDEIP